MQTKPKTVIVKLKGGMGNQMFQYAFGKMLETNAKNADTPIELLFDGTAYTDPNKRDTKRPYYLDLLHTTATLATPEQVEQYRNPYGLLSKITRRLLQKFDVNSLANFKAPLLTPPYKHYYEGYWQTEKYFLPIADQIRRDFTLKNPLGGVAQEFFIRITADPSAVSLFYRRTDYVGHSTFDIGEQTFQKRAIKKMLELVPNATFYVTSDDIAWVKENAELPVNCVFVSSPTIPPEEEMMLDAACQHHIIPNSSYAWWGAWLNNKPNKIVIAPETWVLKKPHQFKDIVPENWLRT